jgi:hypothetical protein
MQPSSTYSQKPGGLKGRVKKTKTATLPFAAKEDGLEAIIENFDGYVWSIDKRLRNKVLKYRASR